MSDYGQDVDLVVRAYVDNDFEIDAEGRCYVVSLIYSGDDEEPYEAHVDLEGVIESMMDFYGDLNGYQKLYGLAHEFSRFAEMLRDVAGRIEDSESVVRDLYEIDD